MCKCVPHLGGCPLLGGRVEGVEVSGVCPQLLHCPSSECITASYEDPQPILHQPKTHLQSGREGEREREREGERGRERERE